MPDPRKAIGACIKVKAILVSNEVECARRYGNRKKTFMVKEVVGEVLYPVANNVTGRGTITRLRATFDMGGGDQKEAVVCISSVQISSPDELLNVSSDSTPAHLSPAIQAATNPTTPQSSQVPPLQGGPSKTAPTQVNPPQGPVPVAQQHGRNWFHDQLLHDINGAFPHREWALRTSSGDLLHSQSNISERFSPLDIFLLMFPPKMLDVIVMETHIKLRERGSRADTTKGEILKLFGIVILISKFEFTDRGSLWSQIPSSKYEVAPNLGRTGMSKNRFEELFSALRFGNQPLTRPNDMTSERYRWLLVDTFVECFNEHRAKTFVPSDLIVADESICRWYGLGGEWINMGLPNYVAIDRKPDSGCEIQNSACGRSGVLLRLKLVKTILEEASLHEEDSEGLLHGTKVLIELVEPWRYTDRMIIADSYFASVGAALKLKQMGLRFIGDIKTATKEYPMAYLGNQALNSRGDRHGVVSVNVDQRGTHLMAFVWVDRDRRYFIASGSSLSEGTVIQRTRWRQLEPGQEDPERTTVVVPQPKAAEIYYSACGKIDQHNRDRVDKLQIDRKIEVKDWSKRVNLTILSMIIVDTWKVYRNLTYPHDDDRHETQKGILQPAYDLFNRQHIRLWGSYTDIH